VFEGTRQGSSPQPGARAPHERHLTLEGFLRTSRKTNFAPLRHKMTEPPHHCGPILDGQSVDPRRQDNQLTLHDLGGDTSDRGGKSEKEKGALPRPRRWPRLNSVALSPVAEGRDRNGLIVVTSRTTTKPLFGGRKPPGEQFFPFEDGPGYQMGIDGSRV
ncbi:hypothetical protein BaRGS_00016688, partial [Batillaria attramentaria]